MERILTAEQMRAADNFTIEKLGIAQSELVLRAGKAVAEEILKKFKGGRALVCIGKGNNGADGRVIADILSKVHGFAVNSINIDNGLFGLFEKKYDIIVDCIFGMGLNKNVEGKYLTAIEKINSSGAYVVSCDIPSGLNADTGLAMGAAVKADLTVAIQEYKLGHFINDGKDYCGKVVAKDIGISVWEDDCVKIIGDEEVRKFFPERNHNVNKGDFGKCAVIGGSKEFTGSSLLSANALASMKTGVGYAYLFVPESLLSVYAGNNPEIIVSTVKDENGHMIFDEESLKPALKFDSVAIGMGMGKSEETFKIVKYFLENFTGRLLIDADGLNSLSAFGTDVLKTKKCDVILTPHIGEFLRLLQSDKASFMSDIIAKSKQFADDFSVTLLVKNAVSVITDGKETYINVTGSSGLAKAGSGDVLSGVLCGMLTSHEDAIDVVTAGARLFGRCGEIAEKEQNVYTMTATDVIKALPEAINEVL